MENIRDVLAYNLKRIRREKGVNQKQAAIACGFEVPSFNRWENGRSWPSPDTIHALAKFYKVQPTDFYRPLDSIKPTLTEAVKVIEQEVGIRIEISPKKRGSKKS